MAQIFLCYAREDRGKVESLYQRLSDAGFKPWMDIKNILPGERWELAVKKAVRRSDFFLACLSAHSVDKRGWIQREIKEALDIWQEKLEDDIYLIPVRLEDCEVLESLCVFQWVNLFEEDGWTRLVKAIQVGMGRRAKVVKPIVQETTSSEHDSIFQLDVLSLVKPIIQEPTLSKPHLDYEKPSPDTVETATPKQGPKWGLSFFDRLFNIQRIICPYCLAEIRGRKNVEHCPRCKTELPVQYVHDYGENPPFFAQAFGWSRVGKTIFLSALTLMLTKMSNVWPRYAYTAATYASQHKVQEIHEYLAKGKMPPLTQLGPQEVYIMILRNMERWGGRALVMRDCAGEIFDSLQVPVDQAPFLLNTPITFMLISLPDLPYLGGRSMDMLMNRYINTLMGEGIDFEKERRKLVVIFTKADIIDNLPDDLRNYIESDSLWAAVNEPGSSKQMDAAAMQEYLEIMGQVSDTIHDWIQQDASGKTFVRLAENKNIELRFSLISSTGAPVDADGPVVIMPRRVLDPFFWALELQSHN